MPDELTEGRTSPAGTGAATPSPTPSTGRMAVPAGAGVSAVVLVRNGSRWLAECLDGIAAQTVVPQRLVIVDVASTDSSSAIAQAHQGIRRVVRDVRILRLDTPVSIGRAIDRGVATLWPSGTSQATGASDEPVVGTAVSTEPVVGSADLTDWVWVLHAGSSPRPSTLARLLDAVRGKPSVGIAGPKIVDWDDPRRLVGLGIGVTRTGRLMASPARGEADQGQYDGREDVLAVSTNGMLVRRDVHTDLGGFDPSFDHVGGDLDLGWRAHLAGHRVVVVPDATLREAEGDAAAVSGLVDGAPALERRRRRAARQVALTRCSPFVMPVLGLWMALSSIASALLLLVAKKPRVAWRELGDVAALAHPLRVLGARWRGRRTRRLSRGNLVTLFVSPSAAARATIDHIQDAITPERDRVVREPALPQTETGPTSEESDALAAVGPSLPHRVATNPGLIAVVAVIMATGFAWRDAIRSGALSVTGSGLAGGELRPVTSNAAELWHAFRDSWHGAGLGTGGESGPHLAVLSFLTWLAELVPGVSDSRSTAGVTVAWLLFLAPALAAWASYLAGRVVTSARAVRAVVAVAWGASSILTTAVADGRVTAALAHALFPLVLAGFCLAARRDGTYTATFATALATAVLGAFVPPLLVVTSLIALGLLVVGRGVRRLHGLVLLVVPPALLGPWVSSVVADWRTILSGPGLIATGPWPEPWRLVLGQPSADGRLTVLSWFVVPVIVAGVAGYAARSRSRAESVGLAVSGLAGLAGLAMAVAAGRVSLGSAETGVGRSDGAHLWAGVGLDLWFAAVLVGVLFGGAGMRRHLGGTRPASWRHARTLATTAAASAVAVAAVAGAGAWAVAGIGQTLSVGRASLPAVAVDQSGDALSNRLLLLRPSDTVVDFVLAGREPGELLRDLDRPPAADAKPLLETVARLVGAGSADAVDATGLARWGIGFVQARTEADAALVRRLDATRGLSRLGASEHGILWKVLPDVAADGSAAAPSRLRIVDERGQVLSVVPTTGPHAAARTAIQPADLGRQLVVAEPAEWAEHAIVRVGGRELAPVAGASQPTYAIPPAGGQLHIDLEAAHPWWRLGQAVLLALVVFLALPFGNRRSRRPPS